MLLNAQHPVCGTLATIMIGLDIINKQIGRPLNGGLIQSFYLDKELNVEVNVTFLQFDEWLHLTVSDERTVIKEVVSDYPMQIETFSHDGSIYEYPLTKIDDKYPDFKNYLGRQLTDVHELLWDGIEGYSVGLKMDFDKGLTLVLYSDTEDKTVILFDDNLPDRVKIK